MPEFKDGFRATPVPCKVDISSKGNPTIAEQQEGAKVKKGKKGGKNAK